MTKDEVLKALSEGKKVTHAHFTGNEWLRVIDDGYEFEDGVQCAEADFWHFRTDWSWQKDWSIFNDIGE